MTSSICANCLLRLRVSAKIRLPLPSASLTATQSFHTTPTFQSVVLKKKSGPIQPKKFRESTSAKIKKKQRRERPKPPEVGERKALRKRIVLSNTNALEISGMEDMTPENMADESRVGQMLGLEGALLDQLREAKAFKPTQNWKMFRRPATLIRRETVALAQSVQEVNQGLAGEGLGALTLKQVITGERSTGKSLLLLQAMSMAYLNNWIVLNVPEGMYSLMAALLTVILTCQI